MTGIHRLRMDGWTAESVGMQVGFKGKVSISTSPQQGAT